MEQYNVTGMSCAACVSRVEKAVNKVPGVTTCAVSLLTNSMGVEGTATSAEIIKAVTDAGYGASLKSGESSSAKSQTVDPDALADKETPLLLKRLFSSLGFLMVLMYFSMGHMMWNWPIPSFFEGNHVAMGLVQLVLAGIVMVINQKFFINGFKGLLHRSPNMDTLVALGSMASFVYSTCVLFLMTDAVVKGDDARVMTYMNDMYFESAAMILALITVGKTLESYSKGKTTDALKSLMKLAPKTAVVLVDGVEKTVPIEQVKKGDIFVVRPGENIPVDGVVVEGSSAVNEAALTGESVPVDKAAGDLVSAATLNQSGYIRCEATRVGEDTTLAQIIQMVSDAAATKAPIAKIADIVSGYFVPVVITIAVITTVIWLLVGQEFGYALARGISVLVISCPCALGLATPVAIMVGNGKGARNGILFKNAVSLEETGKVQIVALDKTGTITKGEPEVTDLIPAFGWTTDGLLEAAYALEQQSEHPLSKAIMKYGAEKGCTAQEISEFEALPGNGLTGVWKGNHLYGGNYKYISTKTQVSEDILAKSEELASQGKTPLFFCQNDQLAGVIAVADVIKEDSPQAIKELQNMGIHVVMLTGDNEKTAKAIGAQAGVDDVIAGVLPEGKEAVIRQLKEFGKVAMVGDGINDAPALTRADMGIAIGAGTDVAIDAADVVLMKSRLLDVAGAVRLSRATLKNIHENLFWAFFYNVLGIPLAAGAYVHLFGWTMNPMFGAAAMSLSSFCVVSNALRLNLFKVFDASKDKKRPAVAVDLSKVNGAGDVEAETPGADGVNAETTGVDAACVKTYIYKIEGMMCEHCEAFVKNLLESYPQVISAEASHEAEQAVVKATDLVDLDDLKVKLAEDDYILHGVEEVASTAHTDGGNSITTYICKIEGMMCEHCEAFVKNLLESYPQVISAEASHEAEQAVVKATAPLDFEDLKAKLLEDEYILHGIEE